MSELIEVGQLMPDGTFGVMTTQGPGAITTDELFNGKRVALFSVPGAFTTTCSMKHLPGYIKGAEQLHANGIDTVACTAVNDLFVMEAWSKSTDAGSSILMLADGNGDYVRSLGLESDSRRWGMGFRGQRFSMIVADNTVKALNIETGGEFKVSSCEYMLEQLQG